MVDKKMAKDIEDSKTVRNLQITHIAGDNTACFPEKYGLLISPQWHAAAHSATCQAWDCHSLVDRGKWGLISSCPL